MTCLMEFVKKDRANQLYIVPTINALRVSNYRISVISSCLKDDKTLDYKFFEQKWIILSIHINDADEQFLLMISHSRKS